MTYHQVCNNYNTTVATCGAGTADPSATHAFTPVLLSWVGVARSFFDLLFFFLLAVVLSARRFTADDHPFGIFKLFL
jgi:hypothetical protein